MWLTLALISAFFASASSILEKKILLKEHALEFSSTLAFYCFLISIPLFWIFDHNSVPHVTPLLIMALTSILGGTAFLLISKSVRHMEISEVSPLIAISPAITATFGFIFLGESLSLLQISGITIIIIGIYILELKDRVHPLLPFKRMYESKYIHLIFFALLLYGITDVLGKLVLTKHNLQPTTVLFYYQLFLASFFLVVVLLRKRMSSERAQVLKSNSSLVIIVALLVIAYRYTHLSAVKIANIGVTLAILRSSTLITTVIGGRLYKEEGIIRKSIAALAVILGIVLVAL